MKKITSAMLLLCMMSLFLVGCKEKTSDETILILEKKGSVSSVDVEEFEESYYSVEEFTAFAEEAISDYNGSHEVDAVSLESFVVEEGLAKLKMKFKSFRDYSAFTDVPLFFGSIEEAMEEGYLFDATFSMVEKGKITGTARKEEVLEEQTLKVVILRGDTLVQVPGKVMYVAGDDVELTAKDCVSIKDMEQDNYIIYK